MNEEYRDIAGYEGLYQVSNLGNVKALKRVIVWGTNKGEYATFKEMVLRPFTMKIGYKQVVLSKDNIQQHFLVHRLVASAFIPNTLNKPQVNHIDGNRANNELSNLEWCDQSENNYHYNRRRRSA